MQDKHTGTPWKVTCGLVETEDGREICRMDRSREATKNGIYPCERDNNAKFIVKACNHHDELVSMVRDLVRTVEYHPHDLKETDSCLGDICGACDNAKDLLTRLEADDG